MQCIFYWWKFPDLLYVYLPCKEIPLVPKVSVDVAPGRRLSKCTAQSEAVLHFSEKLQPAYTKRPIDWVRASSLWELLKQSCLSNIQKGLSFWYGREYWGLCLSMVIIFKKDSSQYYFWMKPKVVNFFKTSIETSTIVLSDITCIVGTSLPNCQLALELGLKYGKT